ncbi:FAD-binding protein [Deinococcus sp. HMF7620]|uniref:FAD-binding protein n=1 Tax=Deinococcus arboris TaxID=2682977 RepID=A0A7C9LW85_9DEIO|nr:NAD(P)/FAD-dependent oxidoreductase [Deinococcus arboris]MVN88240.1 FAD-binding protein [Deinococcus arboris]
MEHSNVYEVVVVGGGAAGLSAALVLGRSRRRTLVLASGEPRNAPARTSHGFFTRDGISPRELLERGREQLRPYSDVEYLAVEVTGVSGTDGNFEVMLEGEQTVWTRKLVLATGVADELPPQSGFKELWGRGVYSCPYCHGWEVRDRALAVLAEGDEVVERAVLIRQWSRNLVALTHGAPLSDGARERLQSLGVPVYEGRILHLEGKGGSEGLSRIVFEDGSSVGREALFYGPPQRQRSNLAEALGCEIGPMGPAAEIVTANPVTRETSVKGVYAVGDMGFPMAQISLAVAAGSAAAAFINHALCVEADGGSDGN